jgi:3-mercaptopyruvate sulfurtransferase SseA
MRDLFSYRACVLLLVSALSLSVAAQAPAPQGDGVRRATPTEVRQALNEGRGVLVDVRGPNSWQAGHIRGALSIPFDQLLSRLDELPRDKTIFTYCS